MQRKAGIFFRVLLISAFGQEPRPIGAKIYAGAAAATVCGVTEAEPGAATMLRTKVRRPDVLRCSPPRGSEFRCGPVGDPEGGGAMGERPGSVRLVCAVLRLGLGVAGAAGVVIPMF